MWAWAFGFAIFAAMLASAVGGIGYLFETPLLAALLGFVVGLVVGAVRRIDRLERELRDTSNFLLERIRTLEKRTRAEAPLAEEPAAPQAAPLSPEAHVFEPEPVPASEPEPAPPEHVSAVDAAEEAVPPAATEAREQPPEVPPPSGAGLEAYEPQRDAWLWRRIADLFTGENAVVRVGLGLTFLGLAFLYAYGLEQRWIRVEWNYILASAGGLAMLLWGWRLREERRGYALLVQGGGVGVLYSAVFAATRLHGLVPEALAFVLMVALVGLSAALAVLQDAPALAAAGTLGGYFVPLLLFGSGVADSPVPLFAYFALLSVGAVAFLLLKDWPAPVMIGFVFTTVSAWLWGGLRYRPVYFWTAQLFLVAYFVIFLSAAVVHALERPKRDDTRPVDLFLLFATPLTTFFMQVFLARRYPLGPALSALFVAAYFALVARWLWRGRARIAAETGLALAIGFLTLAVPLALSLRTSVLVWAVEGSALVWMSLRYRSVLALLAGVLLLTGVNFAFLLDLLDSIPELGMGDRLAWISELLLALLLGFSAWAVHQHAPALPERFSGLRRSLSLLALFWWLTAGARGILQNALPLEKTHVWLLWATASLGSAAELGRRVGWRELVRAFFVLPLLLLPTAVFVLFLTSHPFELGEAGFWVPVLMLWFYELEAAEGWLGRLRPWGAALGFGFALLLVMFEAAWWTAQIAEGPLWPQLVFAWVPLLALLVLSSPAIRHRWPGLAVLQPVALPAVAAWLALWFAGSSLFEAGDPYPLSYLPVLNPLELSQLLVLGGLVLWWLRSGGEPLRSVRHLAGWILGLTLFVWANTAIGRAVHHLGGVPFDWSTLFATQWFHTALSIFWGLMGLVLMATGSRLARRTIWQAGLALYGLTVAKLFLIDLSDRATVARIVSFLGVGLLLVVTGYFAPRPAASETEDG